MIEQSRAIHESIGSIVSQMNKLQELSAMSNIVVGQNRCGWRFNWKNLPPANGGKVADLVVALALAAANKQSLNIKAAATCNLPTITLTVTFQENSNAGSSSTIQEIRGPQGSDDGVRPDRTESDAGTS